ncbi:amidohydrolase family protein [Paractinoplanes ovalisporus]|nr:amidohydrolase family protein [Actinoplanes ovalisporus]
MIADDEAAIRESLERVLQVEGRRVDDMDAGGLNVQILSAHTPSVQNVPGPRGIDLAYRLNRQLVDGPIAKYPGRFKASPPCPCGARRRRRTNWNARFGRMASWAHSGSSMTWASRPRTRSRSRSGNTSKTTSGSRPAHSPRLNCSVLLKHISVDRLMFATDYPFADIKAQTDWFRGVDLPREDKEKIAFRNAEKLSRIKVPVK